MAKNLDGVIVRIEARHDFNTVVAERVFVPGLASEVNDWTERVIADKMDQAKKEDPTFDLYHFAAEQSNIVVQVSYL